MDMMQPPHMMMKACEPKQLKALLVSDSHVNGAQLNRLAQWLKETKAEYDVVLMAGNMANMVNAKRRDPSAEYLATDQVVDTLTYFLEHVKKPVIYVPGNTEPSASYTYGLDVPNAINAHKRAVQLDESLIVVGLGGSLPVQKDGKAKLEGFPYQKEEDYAKDLEGCLDSAAKTFGPNVDYLLLTHMGPTESATTEAFFDAEKLNVGSKTLGEALKKRAATLLCNVHGHSGLGEGMSKPYGPGVSVINPGAVTDGKFGELTMVRGFNGRWKLGAVNFINLDL